MDASRPPTVAPREPQGFVVLVEPADRIHFLDWGGSGDPAVLLIHGTADVLDVPAQASETNFHAALDAGVPVELQYCPGGTHGQLIEACPAEWARWAQSFLEGATD